MKITIPQKQVEACDICERPVGGSMLTTCVVCGKEYCHLCEAIVAGCVHQPDVCKRCAESDSVRATVHRFSPKISRVLKARDRALRRAKGGAR